MTLSKACLNRGQIWTKFNIWFWFFWAFRWKNKLRQATNMQLHFFYSTMSKWKISIVIPMYIHIFLRGSWQNNHAQSQQTIVSASSNEICPHWNINKLQSCFMLCKKLFCCLFASIIGTRFMLNVLCCAAISWCHANQMATSLWKCR